jgi:tripartite-type tricarboxylate transporter receptor subunit TctC
MKFIKHTLSAAALLIITLSAQAQGYPNKPVKILVGYAAGSSTDIAGRLMGQALSDMWKQPVVVENRGGAAGNLAADAVAKSAGDGYTLLFAQNGLAISTASNPKLPFNGEKDLIPVAAVAATPHILIVPNSSPAKSVQDLIDMAKKSKAALNFGSSGIGNSDHMAAELFKVVTGIGGVHIPYRGGSLAATDTISGQLDFYFAGMPVGLPQAQAGRVRALAVTGKERFAAAPDVKTVAEQGIPNFEHVLWQGFFMPKSAPPELVKKISDDVLKILASKEFRDNLATKGISTFALASGPFQAYYQADIEKWRGVVKASGIMLE